MLLSEFLASFGNFTLGLVIVFIIMTIFTTLVYGGKRKNEPWLYARVNDCVVYSMIVNVCTLAVIYFYKFIAFN